MQGFDECAAGAISMFDLKYRMQIPTKTRRSSKFDTKAFILGQQECAAPGGIILRPC